MRCCPTNPSAPVTSAFIRATLRSCRIGLGPTPCGATGPRRRSGDSTQQEGSTFWRSLLGSSQLDAMDRKSTRADASGCLAYLARLQAPCAHPHTNGLAVLENADALQVRHEAPLAPIVRVAHAIAGSRPLITYVAEVCHLKHTSVERERVRHDETRTDRHRTRVFLVYGFLLHPNRPYRVVEGENMAVQSHDISTVYLRVHLNQIG